jgi:hypothetical protein
VSSIDSDILEVHRNQPVRLNGNYPGGLSKHINDFLQSPVRPEVFQLNRKKASLKLGRRFNHGIVNRWVKIVRQSTPNIF